MYGSEAWITYRHNLRLLERFHQRCLRIIFNIHWSDYITNVEVLEQAEVTSIEAMLMKSKLRWAKHVYRMGDYRLPMMILYGELSTGYRDRRGVKRRYKNSLKKPLSTCHIDHSQWSTLVADCGTWHHIIHQAASSFDNSRRINLKEKRCRRKNREASTVVLDITFNCSRCGRTCLSRIGQLATSALAVDVGNPFIKSSFVKLNQEVKLREIFNLILFLFNNFIFFNLLFFDFILISY